MNYNARIFDAYITPMKKFLHIEHMPAPLFELIDFILLVYFAMPFCLPISLLVLTPIMISLPHILFSNPLFSGKVLGISIVVYSQTLLSNILFKIFGPHGAMPKPIFPISLPGGTGEKNKSKNYRGIFQYKNTVCNNKN